MSTALAYTQRPSITRRWTHAVLCLGWLNIFWKSGEGGSCKGCAVPPAYTQGCPAVIRGVLLLWKRRITNWCTLSRHALNFQYPIRAEPLVFLTSLCVYHILAGTVYTMSSTAHAYTMTLQELLYTMRSRVQWRTTGPVRYCVQYTMRFRTALAYTLNPEALCTLWVLIKHKRSPWTHRHSVYYEDEHNTAVHLDPKAQCTQKVWISTGVHRGPAGIAYNIVRHDLTGAWYGVQPWRTYNPTGFLYSRRHSSVVYSTGVHHDPVVPETITREVSKTLREFQVQE